MREWINAYNLPVVTVVTKIDNVAKGKRLNVVNAIKKELGGEVFPFSAVEKRYNKEILDFLCI